MYDVSENEVSDVVDEIDLAIEQVADDEVESPLAPVEPQYKILNRNEMCRGKT